jgi:hypothetical protein
MRPIAALLPGKGVVYGGAILLLALQSHSFSARTHAGEPKTAVSADLSPRDWVVTTQARKALQKDAQLSTCRIGVSVKDKVATIWGSIPNADMIKRAEEALKKVPGIVAVISECRIVPADDPIPQAVADAVKKAQGDPGTSAKLPLPPPAAPTGRVVTAKPPEGFVPRPNTETGNPAVPSQPAAVLLNPVPTSGIQVNAADPLESARLSDKRFKDLVLELRGGVVRVSGSAARMKDAVDLAEKINDLPGVRQVILGNVQEK